MSKKQLTITLILAAATIFGFFLKYSTYPFLGGMIAGSCGLLLVLYSLGRMRANESASAIDKKIQDRMDLLDAREKSLKVLE